MLLVAAVRTNPHFMLKANADVRAIARAVQEYAGIRGRYPESIDDLVSGGFIDTNGPPKDPWGRLYGYRPPAAGSDFMVFSYGKDGVPGGAGDDADVQALGGNP